MKISDFENSINKIKASDSFKARATRAMKGADKGGFLVSPKTRVLVMCASIALVVGATVGAIRALDNDGLSATESTAPSTQDISIVDTSKQNETVVLKGRMSLEEAQETLRQIDEWRNNSIIDFVFGFIVYDNKVYTNGGVSFSDTQTSNMKTNSTYVGMTYFGTSPNTDNAVSSNIDSDMEVYALGEHQLFAVDENGSSMLYECYDGMEVSSASEFFEKSGLISFNRHQTLSVYTDNGVYNLPYSFYNLSDVMPTIFNALSQDKVILVNSSTMDVLSSIPATLVATDDEGCTINFTINGDYIRYNGANIVFYLPGLSQAVSQASAVNPSGVTLEIDYDENIIIINNHTDEACNIKLENSTLSVGYEELSRIDGYSMTELNSYFIEAQDYVEIPLEAFSFSERYGELAPLKYRVDLLVESDSGKAYPLAFDLDLVLDDDNTDENVVMKIINKKSLYDGSESISLRVTNETDRTFYGGVNWSLQKFNETTGEWEAYEKSVYDLHFTALGVELKDIYDFSVNLTYYHMDAGTYRIVKDFFDVMLYSDEFIVEPTSAENCDNSSGRIEIVGEKSFAVIPMDIQISLYNFTDEDAYYGESYKLYKKSNGAWTEVSLGEAGIFREIAYSLSANSKAGNIQYLPSNLENGEYRISKQFLDTEFYDYFTIGTNSNTEPIRDSYVLSEEILNAVGSINRISITPIGSDTALETTDKDILVDFTTALKALDAQLYQGAQEQKTPMCVMTIDGVLGSVRVEVNSIGQYYNYFTVIYGDNSSDYYENGNGISILAMQFMSRLQEMQ